MAVSADTDRILHTGVHTSVALLWLSLCDMSVSGGVATPRQRRPTPHEPRQGPARSEAVCVWTGGSCQTTLPSPGPSHVGARSGPDLRLHLQAASAPGDSSVASTLHPAE